jgi:putative endonuclease
MESERLTLESEPLQMKQFFVYILFNPSRTLYVGVTNDLVRRVHEHRAGKVAGFTAKYKVNQLAYYEIHADPASAIEREKQIKGWTRAKKVALIEEANPNWDDLSNHLGRRDEPVAPPTRSGEPNGFAARGQILRCAQDDGLTPSQASVLSTPRTHEPSAERAAASITRPS